MRKLSSRILFDFQPFVLICAALCIIFIPLQWIFAWCIAVAVHEMYHYFAIKLCGCQVYTVRVGLLGAVMESNVLTRWQETVCALAGPLGSLSLLLFMKWLPRTSICGFLHAAYNLLPIFPLDGGRALRCILALVLGERNGQIAEKIVGYFVKIALVSLGIYGAVILRLGLLPLAAVLLPIVKNIKTPCKERLQQVQ